MEQKKTLFLAKFTNNTVRGTNNVHVLQQIHTPLLRNVLRIVEYVHQIIYYQLFTRTTILNVY